MSAVTVGRAGGRGLIGAKGIQTLAWVSLAFGVIGGSAMMTTFVGDFAEWLGGLGTWVRAAAMIVLVVGTIAFVIDVVIDGTPNRLAIWCAILLPTDARAVGGRFAEAIRAGAAQVTAAVSAHTASWFGTPALWVLAVLGVAGALLVAKRVVRKGGG